MTHYYRKIFGLAFSPLILYYIISFIFQILTWHDTHYIKCRVFTILRFIIQWCKIMFYNHFYDFKSYYMYLCMHTSAYVCMCMTMSQRVRLENNFLGSVLSLYVGLRNWIQFMKIDGKSFFFYRATLSTLFHLIKLKFLSLIINPLIPLCPQYQAITIPRSTFMTLSKHLW